MWKLCMQVYRLCECTCEVPVCVCKCCGVCCSHSCTLCILFTSRMNRGQCVTISVSALLEGGGDFTFYHWLVYHRAIYSLLGKDT